MPERELTVEDYGYCIDCQCYFDLWKYGNAKDAGHSACNWRYVTEAELEQCIETCKELYPRCQNCDSLNVGDALNHGQIECPDCGVGISTETVHWVNCFNDC